MKIEMVIMVVNLGKIIKGIVSLEIMKSSKQKVTKFQMRSDEMRKNMNLEFWK